MSKTLLQRLKTSSVTARWTEWAESHPDYAKWRDAPSRKERRRRAALLRKRR